MESCDTVRRARFSTLALRGADFCWIAFPHRLVSDDVYDGMYLPAGSVVLGNTW